jgi:hypothetical protein
MGARLLKQRTAKSRALNRAPGSQSNLFIFALGSF